MTQRHARGGRRQPALAGFRPFDEDDRVVEVRLEVAPLLRVDADEAEEVEVADVRVAGVPVPDREGRAGHRRGHAERAARAPDEGRLPGAELTGDGDDVAEVEACESHLFRQIELIQPRLVATLGNFATKLLSGKQTGITRVHGQPQDVVLGGRPVTLYPLYHPAAALYTRSMLSVLEADFARIPDLIGRPPEPPPRPAAPSPAQEAVGAQPVQLGLF